MINIIALLTFLSTSSYAAVAQQTVCRGDNSLNHVVDVVTLKQMNHYMLEGIKPSTEKLEIYGNQEVGAWVMSFLQGTISQHIDFKQNQKRDEEPNKKERETAQTLIFTQGRSYKGDHLANTQVYSKGNTQMCYRGQNTPRAQKDGRYYFGSGAENWLCTALAYRQYAASDNVDRYYHMVKNRCNAADVSTKATGPITDNNLIFAKTDTANPVQTFKVKKRSEDNSSKPRTLKIYSDGTMSYFKDDNNELKGSFLMTGAPVYVGDKPDFDAVANAAAAKYLKVPRRRMKDGAVNTEDIYFKNMAGNNDFVTLDALKAALEGLNAAANLDAIWNHKCGQCPQEYLNFAIPLGGGHSDRFEESIPEAQRIDTQISSSEGSNVRMDVVMISFALLSSIFVVHHMCGKANKGDEVYEKLFGDEI